MIRIFILIFFIFIAGCIENKPLTSTQLPHLAPDSEKLFSSRACVGENCFVVEVADSPVERSQGLMFRTSMDANAGMVFTFDRTEVHPFWMKNTLIPLDMIWLDENQKIIGIISAPPCEADPCPIYSVDLPSVFVLEINAGKANELGIVVGNDVVFHDVNLQVV